MEVPRILSIIWSCKPNLYKEKEKNTKKLSKSKLDSSTGSTISIKTLTVFRNCTNLIETKSRIQYKQLLSNHREL